MIRDNGVSIEQCYEPSEYQDSLDCKGYSVSIYENTQLGKLFKDIVKFNKKTTKLARKFEENNKDPSKLLGIEINVGKPKPQDMVFKVIPITDINQESNQENIERLYSKDIFIYRVQIVLSALDEVNEQIAKFILCASYYELLDKPLLFSDKQHVVSVLTSGVGTHPGLYKFAERVCKDTKVNTYLPTKHVVLNARHHLKNLSKQIIGAYKKSLSEGA